MTFIQRCLDGKAHLDEIDDYMEEWHQGDDDRPIWEFLGMEQSEYELWVTHPESLDLIIAARREGR